MYIALDAEELQSPTQSCAVLQNFVENPEQFMLTRTCFLYVKQLSLFPEFLGEPPVKASSLEILKKPRLRFAHVGLRKDMIHFFQNLALSTSSN